MEAAAPQVSVPKADISAPRRLPDNFERLVGAWHRIYLLAKKLEPKVEAARKTVVSLLVAAGVPVGEHIATKYGSISLQTKVTTNWEAMARSTLAPAFIEQLVPQFTKTGDPFTRAPQSWAGEAK
ncbi:MAG TPA: hypothetical protein VGF94_08400 [Kofleriaceae bacterium]|jgi:hypothetical protein